MVIVNNDYSEGLFGRKKASQVKSKFNNCIFYSTNLHRFSLDGFING